MISASVKNCLKNFAAAALILLPLTSSAYTTSYYSTSSKLAHGRWVKIKVNHTGIVQIDPQTLSQCGFSDPSQVSVYGYGGTRLTANSFDSDLPDDLQPTTSYLCPDGRILFYAEADHSVSAATAKTIKIRRNYYDHNGYYFLTEAKPADAPARLQTKPAGTPLDSHFSVSFIENEVQNPGQGGSIFHDRKLIPGQKIDYDLEIRDFNPTDKYPVATLLYNYGIYNNKSTSLELSSPSGITVSAIYNSPAGTQTQDIKLYANGSSSASISEAPDGVHTFRLGIPDGTEPSYAAVDWVGLVYPRHNRLSGAYLDMNFLSAKTGSRVDISEAADNTLVWDITDAARVTPCPVYYDESNSTLSAVVDHSSASSSTTRLLAFDPDALYPAATACGEIANQNLHGSPVPDMVIITTADLLATARQLADIHSRYDGLEVAVIDQQTIFNEFSSGSRAAMAFRRYLKMLYDREPQTLKHVLLYGTSWWDNRSDYAADKLICFEAENPDHARDVTKNYTSDKYFVMLEDGFDAAKLHKGKVSVAVGRISVDNETQGRIINDKIERYILQTRGHDVYGNILVLSDDGDSQGHFLDAEKIITEMQNSNQTLTFTRAHNLIYPFEDATAVAGRKAISHALTAGQGMMLYCGHCSQDAFTGERLFDTKLITSTSYDTFPFAMLATCETFSYDRFNNLVGNALINAAHGGAIAVVGSCRQVYMEYNRAFAMAVSKAYAEAGRTTTIGEIARDAHNYCILNYAENDRAVNNLCFNLYGDPALKVYATGHQIVIDDINGLSPADNATIAVSELEAFAVNGHIEGTTFDGEAVIRVYDRPYTVETNERTKYEDQTKKYPVTLDEKIIATQRVKVTDGRFAANITIPALTDGHDLCRITVSAVADDNSAAAAFAGAILDVNENSDMTNVDLSAPIIAYFYLNDINFVSGDVLGPDVNVHALIELPASGLKLNGAFKDGVSLRLDGHTSYDLAADAIKLNTDGTASFAMSLADLNDGIHHLTLTVKSNTDVPATKTIDFKVLNSAVDCSLAIDSATVRETLSIDIQHSFSTTPSARLIIEDHLGNTVFSTTTGSLPYDWDLCDNDGNKVADGRYSVSALLHNDLNRASTAKVDFVVVK